MALVTIVLAAICAFGWLNQWVANAALVAWMLDKGVGAPGPEIKDYLAWAWKRTLGVK